MKKSVSISFKEIPLRLLRQELSVLEKILAKIHYSKGPYEIRFTLLEFIGNHFEGRLPTLYNRVIEILKYFKHVNVLNELRFGEPMAGRTPVICDVNEKELKLYQRHLLREVRRRDPDFKRVSASLSQKISTKPSYNPISYKISFMGKPVPIPPDSNQDALCRVVFRNEATMSKTWDWTEMLDKWGGHYEGKKDSWRKVYNAGREVNKKVAVETGIKDFLIVKKYTVALNPDFLKVR